MTSGVYYDSTKGWSYWYRRDGVISRGTADSLEQALRRAGVGAAWRKRAAVNRASPLRAAHPRFMAWIVKGRHMIDEAMKS